MIRIAEISSEPLDITAHLAAAEDLTTGAVASFIGTVRDHDPDADGAVLALEYTAHPDAVAALRRIVAAAVGTAEATVAVSHRVGRLVVGDAAVVIAVGTAHRAAAFEICRDIIERIKTDLPVWKKQVTADGRSQWKGLGG